MKETVSAELISVVIPVYNGERFIAGCMESVLAQTYTNYELIVVDDGSKDTTLGIIKEYAQREAKIKYVHTENKGVCHARNTGIELAAGDYITFLDADDRLRPNALAVMTDLLKNNAADLAIVSATTLPYGEGADEAYMCKEKVFVWSQEEAMQKMIEDHYSMHTVFAKLYKKELLRDIRFVEGRKIHEDNFFVFECLTKASRAVFQNNKVYLYTLVSGSASRSAFSDKFFDILYFADRKVEIVERMFPAFRDKTPLILTRARRALLINLCKTYDKKYRAQQEQCLRVIRKNMHMLSATSAFDKRLYFAIRFRLFWLYKWYIYTRMSKNF